MTKAVILAGGYGTRLRPLTFTTPKVMIPLVNKPVIEYIVDYLAEYGLKDIVITLNYLREQTINYLSKRKDLKLSYPEEPLPLGTAGSVKNAGITATALVIQGDNITDMDLRKVLAFHEAHGKLVTIALLPVPNPSLYGIAEIEPNGMIRKFKEKPSPNECFSNLANTGVYVIEPEALEYVLEGCAFDFSKDLFPILVAKNEVYGCVVEGFWTDVGSRDGYMEASRWILAKKGFECAATADIADNEIRGDVAIGEHAVIKQSVIRGPAVIGNHASVMNSELHESVVFPRAVLDEATLNNCMVGEDAIIKEAEMSDSILGANCEIKACGCKGGGEKKRLDIG
ncbi:mannose-1-phosphate guanylyltransferase / phosphomannomutase [Candidatus Methanophagaceae archaeon]|nr:mannose-1-phosphate guanylyltransferase / phosphomannomutase [Methanophagales archaeon]